MDAESDAAPAADGPAARHRWSADLPARLREHPVPAILVALTLGWVVGKLLRR